MFFNHHITRQKLLRHWPIILLGIMLSMLALHKYVFPFSPYYVQNSSKPKITLYSNPTYYNAVLPWLLLNQKQRKFQLDHKIWINITRLQFQIRHNQGEFWITSLEGAAQAWQHGADLKILMVMGWKKWNLISTLSEEEFLNNNHKIIYYPQYNNSARNVLKEIFSQPNHNIEYQPMELSRLIEKMNTGQLQTALLQTPLSAFVMMNQKKIKNNISIEQLYIEKKGKVTRFPWIVLAVRNKWALEHRDLVEYIQRNLRREAYILNLLPVREISKIWENFYESDIPADILENLLKQEKLQSIPAAEVEEQIKFLLNLTTPYIKYSPDLIWNPARQTAETAADSPEHKKAPAVDDRS